MILFSCLFLSLEELLSHALLPEGQGSTSSKPLINLVKYCRGNADFIWATDKPVILLPLSQSEWAPWSQNIDALFYHRDICPGPLIRSVLCSFGSYPTRPLTSGHWKTRVEREMRRQQSGVDTCWQTCLLAPLVFRSPRGASSLALSLMWKPVLHANFFILPPYSPGLCECTQNSFAAPARPLRWLWS